VVDQHREADLLERVAEFGREPRLVRSIAVQKRREIQRGDPVVVIERIALALGEAIGMGLLHLVVAAEILV